MDVMESEIDKLNRWVGSGLAEKLTSYRTLGKEITVERRGQDKSGLHD